MSTGARSAARAPQTLLVEDALEALLYYRDLGFEVYIHRDLVQVRIGRSTLRLRPPMAGESLSESAAASTATVQVDLPYRLLRQVSDRKLGAVLPEGVYGFADGDGNVVAFEAARGVVPTVKRLLWPGAVDGIPTRFRAARSRKQEARHQREFGEFARRLPHRHDPFYVFLRRGMLHRAVQCLRFLQDDTNVVLIGSALAAEDVQWIRAHLRRPFFHIGLAIDEISARDFVLATSESSFGWIDVDCMVLDPELLSDLAGACGAHPVSGVWWEDVSLGFPVAHPDLQFVDINAVRAVREAGLPTSANLWSVAPHPAKRRQVDNRFCYGEVVTSELARRLVALSPNAMAVPRVLERTHMLQALVHSVGSAPVPSTADVARTSPPWHGRAVRLGCPGPGTTAGIPNRALAEHVQLAGADELPRPYVSLQDTLCKRFEQLGATPQAVAAAAHVFLREQHHVTAEQADAILRRPG